MSAVINKCVRDEKREREKEQKIMAPLSPRVHNRFSSLVSNAVATLGFEHAISQSPHIVFIFFIHHLYLLYYCFFFFFFLNLFKQILFYVNNI